MVYCLPGGNSIQYELTENHFRQICKKPILSLQVLLSAKPELLYSNLAYINLACVIIVEPIPKIA